MPQKYQIFPEDEIPHQPPQLSEEQWKALGFRGIFWIGFAFFYVIFTVLYYSLEDLVDLRSPIILAVIAVSVILAIFPTKWINEIRRHSQWRKLDAQQRERESQEAEERRKEAESLSANLNNLLASSNELAMKPSEYLKNASGWLQIAGREYAENAYDPFWTAVENAAKNIDAFNHAVNALSSNTRNYYAQLEGKNHTFPVFPVRLESLPDPKPVMEEFRRVVRMGQTNFQFANIWEHRKTREVLIAGFQTLGDAVNNLASVVEREISGLRDTLHSDLVQVVEEQIRTREAAEESVKQQAETRESIEQLKRR